MRELDGTFDKFTAGAPVPGATLPTKVGTLKALPQSSEYRAVISKVPALKTQTGAAVAVNVSGALPPAAIGVVRLKVPPV